MTASNYWGNGVPADGKTVGYCLAILSGEGTAELASVLNLAVPGTETS